ncbi:hypothetical protein [Acinetobacter soli]|uniref:hypothetical protein n=1 Tax=Acinetobacter soli TaxID=487316 RepID=UPI00125EDDEF|nr:hypothetical protein [Acinetobacter soli]
MSKNRDKKTNALLGEICSIVDANPDAEFPITMVVSGQIITGTIISESGYYKLPENKVLNDIYTPIKEEKLKYFDEFNNFNNPDISEAEILDIPDDLWQRFIYLKNARYFSGNTFIPSENNSGIAIQVRASDVSAFNVSTFSAVNNDSGD